MHKHTLKIWLSLGTVALAGSSALAGEVHPILGSSSPHGTQLVAGLMSSAAPFPAPQLADSGGESGEVSHDGAITDPVVFIASLARIEAQLRAGISQYQQGRTERAARHFDQIVEMLNGSMGMVLQSQGLDREHVAAEAEVLPMSVRDGEPMEDLMDYLGELLRELDEHALLVPAELRRHPDFRILVLTELLEEAIVQYQALSSDETTTDQKTFLYETVRGLVWTGRDVIGESASELRDRDTVRFHALLAAFDDLQQTLSPVTLPTEPVSPATVLSAISRIEFALSPLTRRINLDSYKPNHGAGGEGGETG